MQAISDACDGISMAFSDGVKFTDERVLNLKIFFRRYNHVGAV